MSYQVLARKWRPKSFSDVVGQSHVLTVLSNALSLGRVHHAYLFSGTRGVGKTSIARLLAKGLNCEKGITADPCGECDNCRDIEQGRFVDLLEIDAASRTKVEDTREILDNIQYLPTKGRFKVYLIDEVHMLSRSSFNALLKTLEEPPEHVKFLLATTDPQKLPVTILSRCLHLHLNVLDLEEIAQQLTKILQEEQITGEPKAIQLLARAANGSMRDALSLTDQAIALGNGRVDSQSVSTMLGTLDKAIPFALVEALHRADGNELMQHINGAAKQGADWDSLLAETITLLHQIAVLQVIPAALGDYTDDESRIRHLAQYMSPNDIQLFYQILLMGRKDLAYAPDKKIGVEMAFLRALAFSPKSTVNAKMPTPETNYVPVVKQGRRSVTTTDGDLANTNTSIQNQSEQSDITADKIQPIESSNQKQTESPKNTPSFEHVPSATRSILEMREQLVQGDVTKKKSETVAPKTDLNQSMAKQISSQNTKKTIDTLQHTNPTKSYDSADDNEQEEEMTAENYQWQAKSINLVDNENKKLAIKEMREAIEPEKTPEMLQKLVEESILIDKWSAEIEQLDLKPLIKQLAIHSFMVQENDDLITLHLRSSVEHLSKSKANVSYLAGSLAQHRQKAIQLNIVIDDDLTTKTPQEIREALYQQKREDAKKEIKANEKVSMICQIFDARIDEESIRPV